MRYHLTFILGACVALAACQGGGKKTKTSGKTPLVESNPRPTEDNDRPKDRKEDECKTGGIRLNLVQSTVTYDDNLKSVIERACLAGCHVPGGQSAKIMNDYDSARSYAEQMVDSVSNGRMPIGGRTLSNAEIKLFEDWVDAGKPKNSSSGSNSNSNNNQDDSEDDRDDNNDSNTDSDDGRDDFFGDCKDSVGDREDFDKDEILNLAAKKECNDRGKMYDYDLGTCTEDLGDFDCDKSGIADAFKAARIDPAAIRSKIDEFKAEGYTIDQCGFDGKAPLILFIKEYEEITSTDEGIGQRYLCRNGSTYCENN